MNLPEPISDAADKAKDLLATATDKVKDTYNDTADKVKDTYGDATDKVKDAYHDAADKVKDAYHDAADKVKDTYGDAADKVQDLLDQVPAPVKKAGAKTAEAFNKLTTTQKIVGGVLLAAGLTYLFSPKKKGRAKRTRAALGKLLLVVNDRIEGYQRAAAETKDAKLRSYYQDLVSQSQHFASSLNDYLTRKGAAPETGTTLKGKLYRKLMDAQAATTGRDEKSILAANVFGEKWAIRAYKKALRGRRLKGEIRETVKRQFAQSKKTYERLKMLAA